MGNDLRVLIGVPIRQTPIILKEFLESLKDIDKNGFTVDYYFIDDNDNSDSQKLLELFRESADSSVKIEVIHSSDTYLCNNHTHFWSDNLVWKVADYKNKIIQHCLDQNYDYLFLIDSDLILHPLTLRHLVSADKDILSEIFWTRWTPDGEEMPQVWMFDKYSFVDIPSIGSNTELAKNITSSVIHQFRKPGIYKVGGLGACTLIKTKALMKGLNFSKIYNVSFWGEDRHFCIRAVALGLELYVDTTYPALHLYREEDLEKVPNYKASCSN